MKTWEYDKLHSEPTGIGEIPEPQFGLTFRVQAETAKEAADIVNKLSITNGEQDVTFFGIAEEDKKLHIIPATIFVHGNFDPSDFVEVK